MAGVAEFADHFVTWMVEAGAALTLAMACAVLVERGLFASSALRGRRIDVRYAPLVRAAVGGDTAAVQALAASPARHRYSIASLLIVPLVQDRDPDRIARTREVATALSIVPLADRLMRSPRWWRRATALRALGLMGATQRTAAVVAALDDPHADVRGAALDALADLRDPSTLTAVVVRLHDPSLHRGRRAAALAAFGAQGEPFVLDLAAIDPAHSASYARALAICGTARCRPLLCRWTSDPRMDVRAAAFEALARVGLDEPCAKAALEGLDSSEVRVRAMAASALRGWAASEDAAARLAQHLDDSWPVAVRAAQSLKSLRPAGLRALEAWAVRADLAGQLARQMLWEQAAAGR